MNNCTGIGIYVETARFLVLANTIFKKREVSIERIAECYELVLFLKNGGYTVINGKKFPIMAGSVRFLRPGDSVYSSRFNEVYVLHFHVDDPQRGKKVFHQMPTFMQLTEFKDEALIFKELITTLLEQNDFACISCVWELLKRIQAQYSLQRKQIKERTVLQIQEYISNNFTEQLSLEDIAKIFHMHPIYLQRKFKNEAGITPAEYQKKIRLSKAKGYLLATDLTIDEISSLCGFCNPSYFISVFKQNEKLTPLQYRQSVSLPYMQD